MSCLIFLLGQDVGSQVMANGGIALGIALVRYVCQGYPLSPLLFAIVTHPLLVMLSRLAANCDIVGLHFPFGGQLVFFYIFGR